MALGFKGAWGLLTVVVSGSLMTVDGGFILGGSWVVISSVISRVTILISHIRGLITPLITSHEPLSRGVSSFVWRVLQGL